jgi:hypothetical protein
MMMVRILTVKSRTPLTVLALPAEGARRDTGLGGGLQGLQNQVGDGMAMPRRSRWFTTQCHRRQEVRDRRFVLLCTAPEN